MQAHDYSSKRRAAINVMTTNTVKHPSGLMATFPPNVLLRKSMNAHNAPADRSKTVKDGLSLLGCGPVIQTVPVLCIRYGYHKYGNPVRYYGSLYTFCRRTCQPNAWSVVAHPKSLHVSQERRALRALVAGEKSLQSMKADYLCT